MLVTNCFSTQASYENQTKKAVTNKFIQEAMNTFFREQLHVYFLENSAEAQKIADQVLVNKRARESAEKAKISVEKKLSGSIDIANRVQKFVDCRSRDTDKREIYIVEGDSALGSGQALPGCGISGHHARPGQDPQLLSKADYGRNFESRLSRT